jgi:hypothetical protein
MSNLLSKDQLIEFFKTSSLSNLDQSPLYKLHYLAEIEKLLDETQNHSDSSQVEGYEFLRIFFMNYALFNCSIIHSIV